jgi:hypothetical protein
VRLARFKAKETARGQIFFIEGLWPVSDSWDGHGVFTSGM